MFFLLWAPKNQLHFKSVCKPETTKKKKKKLQAIILWSFNDTRIPKGTVAGLFLYFQYLSMKTWSYTLKKLLCWENFNCQISHPEAAYCSNQGYLESRINILQLQSTAAPQHKAKRTEKATGYSTEGHGGQWTMQNGWWAWGGGAAEDTSPHTQQTTEPWLRQFWERTDRTEMM